MTIRTYEAVSVFGELWVGGPRVGECICSADNVKAIADSKAFARKRIAECRRRATYPDASVIVEPLYS